MWKRTTTLPPPTPSCYWNHCDVITPPLVASPLRAILFALFLTYLPHIIRIPLVFSLKGTYNNLMPRSHQISEKQAREKPHVVRAIQRATAAHANSWEAFSLFGFSCLTAHILKLDPAVASSLCSLFLLLRFFYIILYIAGTKEWVGVLRSFVWAAATATSVRMSLLALRQAGL